MKNDNDITSLRHSLHALAETAHKEKDTPDKIKEFLKDLGIEDIRDTGGGFLAFLPSKGEGKRVVFRSELDALPIDETLDLDYASEHEHMSHKCGHDGHMAIICGLAQKLMSNPPENGEVVLLFQPAEETGEGARQMLKHKEVKELNPDFVFALHNVPGIDIGQIGLRKGIFSCAVTSLIVKFDGETSHAAEPHLGKSPVEAVYQVLDHARKLMQTDIEKDDFFLCTITYLKIGTTNAHGTSPGHSRIEITMRTRDQKLLNEKQEEFESFIKKQADKHNLKVKISETDRFEATENDEKAIEIFEKATKKSDAKVDRLDLPFRWGEDFGLFTQEWPGAMCALGAGKDHAALHSEQYDFPDDALSVGINLFYQTALIALKSE